VTAPLVIVTTPAGPDVAVTATPALVVPAVTAGPTVSVQDGATVTVVQDSAAPEVAVTPSAGPVVAVTPIAGPTVSVQLGGTTVTSGSTAATYSAENKQGATIDPGAVVAAHSSGVGVVLASAADVTKPAVGLMVSATLNAVAGLVQTEGIFTLDDWSLVTGTTFLTRGPYFVDPTTPGRLTPTAPTVDGQIVQCLGYALSPTDFDLSPLPFILL
jgi:hypothetical protein